MHLFGHRFHGGHNALNDVRATARCFFELFNSGNISFVAKQTEDDLEETVSGFQHEEGRQAQEESEAVENSCTKVRDAREEVKNRSQKRENVEAIRRCSEDERAALWRRSVEEQQNRKKVENIWASIAEIISSPEVTLSPLARLFFLFGFALLLFAEEVWSREHYGLSALGIMLGLGLILFGFHLLKKKRS